MSGDRPRVTIEEWQHKVRPELSNHGWSDEQIDRAESFFQSFFNVNPAMPDWKPGIDQTALDQTMNYLHAHPEELLGPDHVVYLKSVIEKYISLSS